MRKERQISAFQFTQRQLTQVEVDGQLMAGEKNVL